MHRLKGQDVPSGGRLAGEQPGRSRGAVLSRSGRSTEITRRPLPPLGADSFARARSRPSTRKLSSRREAVLRAAAAGGDEVLKSLAVKIIEEECS